MQKKFLRNDKRVKMTKYIIFDAGPLINFSMNGILHLLKSLKKEFSGKFFITEEVKREVIDYPETIKRLELNALQLEALFNEGVIELPDLKNKQKEFNKLSKEIMKIANSTFYTTKGYINIIQEGEASSLALSKMIKEPNVLAVDERTARMLCENPENLRKLLEKKLHTSIKADKKNYAFFKDIKIIRSTELIYIINKKKLFDLNSPKTLDAMLYGMKYKGCSVSEQEIEQIKKL